MKTNFNNTLYKKLKEKGFSPQHVAEIGVWHPETSNIYDFIKKGIKTTLVEPDPESIELIKKEFKDDNITLHEVAIFDSNCEIELCKRASSTFVSSIPSSPALVNDNYKPQSTDKFTVTAKVFNEIDNGSIDLISVDTEGSEWFVIQNMVSRPTVISLETHGGMYINPYIKEISQWLNDNGYILWYKDRSDSVFVLEGKIHISVLDKMTLFLTNIYLRLRSNRKKLSRFLKQK